MRPNGLVSFNPAELPMNKIQVGAAPSPNLKTVRSKIGSLDNASYKPGGGKVKIENRKLDFSKGAQSKIAAKNEKYTPSGGDKKVIPFDPGVELIVLLSVQNLFLHFLEKYSRFFSSRFKNKIKKQTHGQALL